MRVKNIVVLVLAGLFAVSACKKKKTEPAPTPVPVEPAPTEPAKVEPAPVEPAPVEPAPVEPAPVEPAAAGGNACDAYVAKVIECSTPAGIEMPAESLAAMKEATAQACTAPGFGDVIGKAMEACKDTPCGAAGEWVTCIATKQAELAIAAATAGGP